MPLKKKQTVIVRVNESWGTDRERLDRGLRLWAEYLSRHVPQLLEAAKHDGRPLFAQSSSGTAASPQPIQKKQAKKRA